MVGLFGRFRNYFSEEINSSILFKYVGMTKATWPFRPIVVIPQPFRTKPSSVRGGCYSEPTISELDVVSVSSKRNVAVFFYKG